MKAFLTHLKALITDGDWAADLTKVLGLAIVVCGIVGYFQGRDPLALLGFGSALVATGKFSKQG